MAPRICLETGEAKEYRTYYNIHHANHCDYFTYATKCGMGWNEKPSSHESCNHPDCAIFAAEDGASGGFAFVGWLAFAAIGFSCLNRPYPENMFFLLGSIFFLIMGYIVISVMKKCSQDSRELKEFRDTRTINGITARQV